MQLQDRSQGSTSIVPASTSLSKSVTRTLSVTFHLPDVGIKRRSMRQRSSLDFIAERVIGSMPAPLCSIVRATSLASSAVKPRSAKRFWPPRSPGDLLSRNAPHRTHTRQSPITSGTGAGRPLHWPQPRSLPIKRQSSKKVTRHTAHSQIPKRAIKVASFAVAKLALGGMQGEGTDADSGCGRIAA